MYEENVKIHTNKFQTAKNVIQYFRNVMQNSILRFQVVSSLKREKIKKTNIRYHASDNTGI